MSDISKLKDLFIQIENHPLLKDEQLAPVPINAINIALFDPFAKHTPSDTDAVPSKGSANNSVKCRKGPSQPTSNKAKHPLISSGKGEKHSSSSNFSSQPSKTSGSKKNGKDTILMKSTDQKNNKRIVAVNDCKSRNHTTEETPATPLAVVAIESIKKKLKDYLRNATRNKFSSSGDNKDLIEEDDDGHLSADEELGGCDGESASEQGGRVPWSPWFVKEVEGMLQGFYLSVSTITSYPLRNIVTITSSCLEEKLQEFDSIEEKKHQMRFVIRQNNLMNSEELDDLDSEDDKDLIYDTNNTIGNIVPHGGGEIDIDDELTSNAREYFWGCIVGAGCDEDIGIFTPVIGSGRSFNEKCLTDPWEHVFGIIESQISLRQQCLDRFNITVIDGLVRDTIAPLLTGKLIPKAVKNLTLPSNERLLNKRACREILMLNRVWCDSLKPLIEERRDVLINRVRRAVEIQRMIKSMKDASMAWWPSYTLHSLDIGSQPPKYICSDILSQYSQSLLTQYLIGRVTLQLEEIEECHSIVPELLVPLKKFFSVQKLQKQDRMIRREKDQNAASYAGIRQLTQVFLVAEIEGEEDFSRQGIEEEEEEVWASIVSDLLSYPLSADSDVSKQTSLQEPSLSGTIAHLPCFLSLYSFLAPIGYEVCATSQCCPPYFRFDISPVTRSDNANLSSAIAQFYMSASEVFVYYCLKESLRIRNSTPSLIPPRIVKVAFILAHGGDFAACIFDLKLYANQVSKLIAQRERTRRTNRKLNTESVSVNRESQTTFPKGHFFDVDIIGVQCAKMAAIKHTSVHKYIVRKGQGGRQSTNNGGKTNTAGSIIRAAQEKKYIEEVISIVEEQWSDDLINCEAVFVHCPGRANRSMLLKGDRLIGKWREAWVHYLKQDNSEEESDKALPVSVLLAQFPDIIAFNRDYSRSCSDGISLPSGPLVLQVPITTSRPTYTEVCRTFAAVFKGSILRPTD